MRVAAAWRAIRVSSAASKPGPSRQCVRERGKLPTGPDRTELSHCGLRCEFRVDRGRRTVQLAETLLQQKDPNLVRGPPQLPSAGAVKFDVETGRIDRRLVRRSVDQDLELVAVLEPVNLYVRRTPDRRVGRGRGLACVDGLTCCANGQAAAADKDGRNDNERNRESGALCFDHQSCSREACSPCRRCGRCLGRET